MECSEARELLSAVLDQEATAEERQRADEHLGRCADCKAWWAELGHLTRLLRVRLAEPVPDLSSDVVTHFTFERRRRTEILVTAVGLLLAAELTLGLIGMWRGLGVRSFHDTRHIGWLGAAVLVGVVWVLRRPPRSRWILPLLVVVAAVFAAIGAVDVAMGLSAGTIEMHHVVELVGLLLAVLLARRLLTHRRWPPSSGPRHQLHRVNNHLCAA